MDFVSLSGTGVDKKIATAATLDNLTSETLDEKKDVDSKGVEPVRADIEKVVEDMSKNCKGAEFRYVPSLADDYPERVQEPFFLLINTGNYDVVDLYKQIRQEMSKMSEKHLKALPNWLSAVLHLSVPDARNLLGDDEKFVEFLTKFGLSLDAVGKTDCSIDLVQPQKPSEFVKELEEPEKVDASAGKEEKADKDRKDAGSIEDVIMES